MKKSISVTVLCSVLLFFGCKKEKADEGNGDTVDCSKITFAASIQPLISTRCATSGCHDISSSNGPGPLTNYIQIFTSRNFIITAVTSNRMPLTGPPLTASEKAILKCWVDAGAPNN